MWLRVDSPLPSPPLSLSPLPALQFGSPDFPKAFTALRNDSKVLQEIARESFVRPSSKCLKRVEARRVVIDRDSAWFLALSFRVRFSLLFDKHSQ